MPTRLCPRAHHVTDDSAVFCPQCGARMPAVPAPSSRPPEDDASRRRRRSGNVLWLGGGLLFLCVVCWGAYEASGGSEASATRAATRTAVAAAKRNAQTSGSQPSATVRRMPSPGPSPTRPASATAIPAEPAAPTATASATYDAVSCAPDLIYVSEVTIADGTSFPAGEELYKVWEVRSSGVCAWGPGLELRSVGSDALVTEPVVSVPELAPGEEGVVGVSRTVPDDCARMKSAASGPRCSPRCARWASQRPHRPPCAAPT